MTLDVALVLIILACAVLLFVTERVRIDLVALLVLLAAALSGLLTPAEALSGFSSPAVIIVGAVFVLSGGLSRTGVASRLGHHVLRLAGRGTAGLTAAIMLAAGSLSAFMSNVGVVALLLPVVMDISRRTRIAPSKLLIPLAFSSLLGGVVTLIGTPPNILIADALDKSGLTPFAIFDYTPVGLAVLLAGVAYMTFAGRHLLPARDPQRLTEAGGPDLSETYGLSERMSILHLPASSALAGRTLAESRLGSALGISVLAVHRGGETRQAPAPDFVLQGEDRLLVGGRLDRLGEYEGERHLQFEEESSTVVRLMCDELQFHEIGLAPGSSLVGQTLRQVDFRRRFGLSVLALLHRGTLHRVRLADEVLEEDDVLLVQGHCEQMDVFEDDPSFVVRRAGKELYPCEERLIIVHVPEGSSLAGRSLRDSRLGAAFGLIVLGIARDGVPSLVTDPDTALAEGDVLLVEGRPEDLLTIKGLQDLEIDHRSLAKLELESENVGLAEVVLSPRTSVVGRTLGELQFREKHGLSVLAVLRGGGPIRTHLSTLPLQFGDALLLYGASDKLRLFGHEGDFIVLSEDAGKPPRVAKAPVAVAVVAAVLLSVLLGWLPISLAAILGAASLVLTGCLTMDEAYGFVEWRAVFLIAGMLPLGLALQKSGAAVFLTEGLVAAVGGLGPVSVVAAVFLVTAVVAQVIPTVAAAILMAPIALNAAGSLGLSPYSLMMTVTIAASSSFMSPIAHPSNVLIMGPGGYRFLDYVKVGLPLVLVCLAVVLLVLPFFWPLSPA